MKVYELKCFTTKCEPQAPSYKKAFWPNLDLAVKQLFIIFLICFFGGWVGGAWANPPRLHCYTNFRSLYFTSFPPPSNLQNPIPAIAALVPLPNYSLFIALR